MSDTMALPRVWICHRIHMFSQCLMSVLPALASLECTLLPSEALGALLPRLLAEPVPDLLLLDVTLSAEDSGMLVDLVHHRMPQCKVLLLVPAAVTDRIAALARLGSHGCVGEDVSLDDLCLAIHTLLAGRPYCSPHLANALFLQLSRGDLGNGWSDFVDDVRLTDREQEVLRLIAWEQLSNKQIARRLHVSLYTIKNHVHHIIEKLGVEGRNDAARLAKRRHLLDCPAPSA